MASNLFGWDLLIKSVESEIKSNEDIIVCFTHLVLISNGFKCVGLGESNNLDGSETQTETLPQGWSKTYALRYVYQGRLYILKCTKVDDAVLLNLLRVDERTTGVCQFPSDIVASRTGSLDQMLPKRTEMFSTIKCSLIDKLINSSKTRDYSSQTDVRTTAPSNYPGMVPPAFLPQGRDPIDPLRIPPTVRPRVGEYDLDPLGIGRNPLGRIQPPLGGGGMLYEPPSGSRYPQGPNMGLPPGAVPPGARFDPFRPPEADRFPQRPFNNRPDNDEMPPPGYDDMFM